MAWENFDAEMQRRLGNSFDAGFQQKNGATDFGFYQGNADWQAVGKSLGIGLNNINNLNAAFDFVGKGKKKKKDGNPQQSSGFSGNTQGANISTATAFDPGQPYVPGVPGSPAVAAIEGKDAVPGRVGVPGKAAVAAKNPLSITKMSTAARGPNSWMGAGDFDGNPNNWGAKDLIGAYQAGYTEQDVENFLRQGNNFYPDGSGYRALKEAKKKISTQFVGRQYHPDWKKDYDPGGPASMFGDADLLGNLKAGWSKQEILEYLDNNQQVLNANNKKGVAGGIYEKLNAQRYVAGTDAIDEILPIAPEAAIQAVAAIPAVEAIDPIDAIPARNLLIGNSTLGNAGYADIVAPNRSKSSRSNRSSYGTSQFNRSNFGKKKKSPISVTGLNI